MRTHDGTTIRRWATAGVLLLCVAAVPLRAQTGPAPDPAGIATGDKTSVTDAGGNAFVVSEPTDKAAPDYAEKKKAFESIRPRPQKEPLAVKLADSVGHVKIATNTAWTLNTGYLVLFMQAGFALLTCGLVRRKNAGASDDAELRGLRVRVPRLLRGRLCVSVRRGGDQRGAGQHRRHADAESVPARERAGDFSAAKDSS